MNNIWVVEAKKPEDSKEEWSPLDTHFLNKEGASYKAERNSILASGAWEYRAVEYVRKELSK